MVMILPIYDEPVKQVAGYPNFTISHEGVVTNSTTKQVMKPRAQGKNVRLNGTDVPIAKLLIETFYNEYFNGDIIPDVYDLQFKDGDSTNITLDNVTFKLCKIYDNLFDYMVDHPDKSCNLKQPRELYEELYDNVYLRIPNFTGWAINRNGQCITTVNGYGNQIKQWYHIGKADKYWNLKFGLKDTSHRVIHVMINTFYPQTIDGILSKVIYTDNDYDNCKLNNIEFWYHFPVIDPIDKLDMLALQYDPAIIYGRLKDNEYITIPEFTNYAINRKGQVYAKSSKTLMTNFEQTKANTTINVDLYPDNPDLITGNGQHSYFSIFRLMINTFIVGRMLDEQEYKFYGFKDNNSSNVRLNNIIRIGYDIEDVLNKRYPGYVQIEDSDYAINIDGNIVNMFTNTKMLSCIARGYAAINLSGVSISALHRLLAFAFIPIPQELQDYDTKDLHVHHKDENKLNNTIDPNDLYGPGTNLQWMHKTDHHTHHTCRNGFGQHVPIKLNHVITRTAYGYKNIASACREHDLDPMEVSYALSYPEKLVNDLYQVKYLNDVTNWPKYSVYRADNPEKGLKRDFLTMLDLCCYLNVNRSTALRCIKEKRPTRGGWLISRVERS